MIRQEGDPAGIWPPGGVWVGGGVSEALRASGAKQKLSQRSTANGHCGSIGAACNLKLGHAATALGSQRTNARIVRLRRQSVEPIRNTKSVRFVRLKMYREDLDALVGLFQKACSFVTISDDANRYDSLAEMKQHVGSRIKNLNIRGENPSVHFLLNKAERVPSGTPGQMMTQLFPELRTEEATDAADNLFYTAKELIAAHQQTVIKRELTRCRNSVKSVWIALVLTRFSRERPPRQRRLPELDCPTKFLESHRPTARIMQNTTTGDGGWIKTLCDEHASAREAEK